MRYLNLFIILLLSLFSSCANGQISEYTEFLYEDFEKDSLYVLNSDQIPHIKMCGKHNIIHISKNSNLKKIFNKPNSTYVISQTHRVDTLCIPDECEIYFDGGRLLGNIIFSNTLLTGRVNLKGSTISGTVANRRFYTSWLCNGDGVLDDAYNINQIIGVCDTIIIQRGLYRLLNLHEIDISLDAQYRDAVMSHIGIYRSNKTIIGEQGAVLLTSETMPTICVYSKPYELESRVSNITISNIVFKVLNNATTFNEFCHTLKFVGVDNAKIDNCKFNDFWGDAICLSHYGDTPKTGERTRNSNIIISNNFIYGGSHNNRNGVSIINGENVIVRDNKIVEVSKLGMPGAIDIEPNNSAYTISNISILRNTIIKSLGGAGAINVTCLDREAPAHFVTIEGNRVYDSRHGIVLWIKSANTTNDIYIINNYTNRNTPSYYFGGEGSSRNIVIKGNDFRGKTSAKIGGSIKINNFITDISN